MKSATASKTVQFNLISLILYPVIRALILVLIDWITTRTGLNIVLSESDLKLIIDAIIAYLPEIIAILPFVAANIYLRFVTHEPVQVAGRQFKALGQKPVKVNSDS